ncbi:hypothetical protein [Acidithiobacillus thiooxidans]|uniref:hypothetical protein n=1 Tax=Acidithiobacillus thiooxidans TaxID=930 RepID=UPI0004E23CC6|nr:hypothetical protein [Acidithiobacillus thiooxidans]
MPIVSLLATLNTTFISQVSRLSLVPVPVIKVVLTSLAILWISRLFLGGISRILGAIIGGISSGGYPANQKPWPPSSRLMSGFGQGQGYAGAGAFKVALPDASPKTSADTPPDLPQASPAVPSSSKVNPTDEPTFWG